MGLELSVDGTIKMYYNMYPDQLIYINRIKISHIISSSNIELAKYYMDNYIVRIYEGDEPIYKQICYFEKSDYCFIPQFNYKQFNVLKYILMHDKLRPYLHKNASHIIDRLTLITILLYNNTSRYHFIKLTMKICKIIKRDDHICVMCNSKWNIWNTQIKTVGNNQNDTGVILNCASHICVAHHKYYPQINIHPNTFKYIMIPWTFNYKPTGLIIKYSH